MTQQPQIYSRKVFDLTVMLYDGTRESAIAIVDWLKRDPNVKYQSAEMFEQVFRGNFNDDHNVQGYTQVNRLRIDLGEGSSFSVRPGDYVAYNDEDGYYTSMASENLEKNYAPKY